MAVWSSRGANQMVHLPVQVEIALRALQQVVHPASTWVNLVGCLHCFWFCLAKWR